LRTGFCLLLAGLFLLPFTSAMADNNALMAFRARYDLYINDSRVAEVILQVEKTDHKLRWQMSTTPSGLYALFTSKRPYSESILTRTKGDFRLSSVRNSTGIKNTPQEAAVFDWQHFKLTVTRKNERTQLSLKNEVYDFLSIHWLAAQMSLANADNYQLTFYRKGKLIDSILTKTGDDSLIIGDKSVETVVFEQKFDGLSRRFIYYYNRLNPWLPLKIERYKKGKKTTVMLLTSIDPAH